MHLACRPGQLITLALRFVLSLGCSNHPTLPHHQLAKLQAFASRHSVALSVGAAGVALTGLAVYKLLTSKEATAFRTENGEAAPGEYSDQLAEIRDAIYDAGCEEVFFQVSAANGVC